MSVKKLFNQKGVTLIEVLISIALLGIITTVFIQILNSSILLRSKSDLQAEASAIAMSQLEALKKSTSVPTNLVQTKTERGYEVVTTLTEVTSSLTLNSNPINQADNTPFSTPFISMTVGHKNLSVTTNKAVTAMLADTSDKEMQLDITKNPASSTPIQYRLTFSTPEGMQTISLGDYELLASGSHHIKIVKLSDLKGKFNLKINDSTHEPLQFGIFEDQTQQITITPIGSDTSVSVVQNLSEQGDPNTLKRKYYEVLVTVSKNGQSYARLLSTWTVKGD